MAIAWVNWDEGAPPVCHRGALAIGNFDGVHRGHQALVAELGRQARAIGGPAVAVTFDPHPLAYLRPADFRPLLTTVADRAELLERYGADHVVILRTTPALLRLSPETFFRQVIVDGFQARDVVEGPNFRFGHERQGDMQTLAALSQEAKVHLAAVTPLALDGEVVSSSRVRGALTRGDVRRATVLLGRTYHVSGIVGTGRGRGQGLGFPTANLTEIGTLLPADGVYAVRVNFDSAIWPGAANIGTNPTFGEAEHKVEVHVIGFEGTLTGRNVRVEFIERLRQTRAFAGIADLAAQLRADVEQTRQLVAAEEPRCSRPRD